MTFLKTNKKRKTLPPNLPFIIQAEIQILEAFSKQKKGLMMFPWQKKMKIPPPNLPL
jgi:hypothetical protein